MVNGLEHPDIRIICEGKEAMTTKPTDKTLEINQTWSIWKYPLRLGERQELMLPMGSRFLSVQEQGGVPTLWLLVKPSAPLIGQGFRIIGTGWEIPSLPTGNFLGTVQISGFVWHIFED